MVLGKLCLLLCLNTAQAQSWHSPAFDGWASPHTSAGLVYNIAKWFSTSLAKEDLDKHRQAVHHALNNLENGEMVIWTSRVTDAEGRVQIAYTWPASGKTCRRVYSYVRINENSKAYQDTACLDSNHKTWTFVDKY
jgi:hypothetical protein